MNLLIYIILLFISSCCNTEIEYKMNVFNPTEYIYTNGIDSVKMIIKQRFGHEEFYGMSLASKDYILIHDVFNNYNNINDFVLEEFSTWHKCKSKVYFNKKKEPHIYHASYHIHLERISKYSTKVAIYVFESGIIYKTKFPVLPHLNRVNKLKKLPPTTVEEYEILLIIGKGLGLSNMPPVQIPEMIVI